MHTLIASGWWQRVHCHLVEWGHVVQDGVADVGADRPIIADLGAELIHLLRGEPDADDVIQPPPLATHGTLGMDVPVSVIVAGPPPDEVWICATASARSVTFAASVDTAARTLADVSDTVAFVARSVIAD